MSPLIGKLAFGAGSAAQRRAALPAGPGNGPSVAIEVGVASAPVRTG